MIKSFPQNVLLLIQHQRFSQLVVYWCNIIFSTVRCNFEFCNGETATHHYFIMHLLCKEKSTFPAHKIVNHSGLIKVGYCATHWHFEGWGVGSIDCDVLVWAAKTRDAPPSGGAIWGYFWRENGEKNIRTGLRKMWRNQKLYTEDGKSCLCFNRHKR